MASTSSENTALKAAVVGGAAIAVIAAIAYASRKSAKTENVIETPQKGAGVGDKKPVVSQTPVDANHAKALDLKNAGNKAFQGGRHDEAIRLYTEALGVSDVEAHVIHSNRAAVFISLKQYELAEADARQAIKLQPNWSKGYFRLGRALREKGDTHEAYLAFARGLKINPKDADLLKNLRELSGQLEPSDARMLMEVKLVKMYLKEKLEAKNRVVGADLAQLSALLAAAVEARESADDLVRHDAIDQLTTEHPVDALHLVVLLLLQLGDETRGDSKRQALRTASNLAQQARLVRPDDADTLLLCVFATVQAARYDANSGGEHPDILETARRALRLAPGDSLLQQLVAMLLLPLMQDDMPPVLPVDQWLDDVLLAWRAPGSNRLVLGEVGLRIWMTGFALHNARLQREDSQRRISNTPEREHSRNSLLNGVFKDLFRNELFMNITCDMRLTGYMFEPLLRSLRYAVCGIPAGADFDELMPFMLAIALQNYRNNYIWDYEDPSDEEKELRKIEMQLRNRLSAETAVVDGVPDPAVVAPLVSYAMYRTLSDLPGLDGFVARLDLGRLHPWLSSLLRKTIIAEREERRIERDELECLQSELPTGNYVDFHDSHVLVWDNAAAPLVKRTMRDELNMILPGRRFPGFDDSRPDRVLIAGCGSGQEVLTHDRTYKNAEVTAVDASKDSLAYAVRQTHELGVAAKFYVADVTQPLELADFADAADEDADETAPFDVLQCVGLPSELADPVAGLRNLVNMVRPGGIVKLAAQSRNYAEMISEIQSMLAPHFKPEAFQPGAAPGTVKVVREPTAEEARKARRSLLETDSPEVQFVAAVPAMYTLNEFSNAFFNTPAATFSYGSMAALAQELGLELLAFDFFGVPGDLLMAYRLENPEDPGMVNGNLVDQWFEKNKQQLIALLLQSPNVSCWCVKPIAAPAPSPAAAASSTPSESEKPASKGWWPFSWLSS